MLMAGISYCHSFVSIRFVSCLLWPEICLGLGCWGVGVPYVKVTFEVMFEVRSSTNRKKEDWDSTSKRSNIEFAKEY